MFFQFSPVRTEDRKKPVKKENESEKVEVLSLAPFTPNPKLFFEDVQVGSTVSRKLLIENPTNADVELFVTNHVPEELNVTVNPEQFRIEKKSSTILEVTWSPISEECSRYMITVGDGKRILRDVPVAFKSVRPKKSKTGAVQKKKPQPTSAKQKTKPPVKSSPTKKYYSSKPPYTSPKRYSPKKKFSPTKKFSYTVESASPEMRSQQIYTSTDYTNRRSTFKVHDKENIPFLLNASTESNVFLSPSSATFRLDCLQPVERRETYVVKEKGNVSSTDPVFRDSLENISPELSPRVEANLPRKKQPLGLSNQDNLSPKLTEYIQRRLEESSSTQNFEYKLMQMESYCFTPVSTPLKQKQSFSPILSSTIEKKHSEKKTVGATQPSALENITFELPPKSPNKSSDTYVKSNLSTETYVKGNASYETYIKSNLSGNTYTRDASVGDVANLSISPIPSPNAYKTNVDTSQLYTSLSGEGARQIIEANLWSGTRAQPLSRIEEESYIHHSVRENERSSNRSFLKRKSDLKFTLTPPKRPNVTHSPRDWSKSGGAAIRIAKTTSGLNLKKFLNNNDLNTKEQNDNKTAVLTKQDTHRVIIQNPYLLAATNLADPFMTTHLHVDQEWLDQQQVDFKKWLNALLTPPADLDAEEHLVDVAKVWQECKKREVEAAPTKESVSSRYLVSNRLNSLRKSAQNLFRTKEMGAVLEKVVLAVETNKLMIREDKDIHLNLAMKSEIMSMLLSYNPLWLRIGLETVFNEIIPLKSNSDVIGLSTFIGNRILKDPYLLKKHKSVHSPKYITEFKKFFLKKFLVLVYFLDQAKNKKLIPHDPCLFRRDASIKESREMLTKLAREMLAAVGDITKYLKYLGYAVSHAQTYIHEFDYAVTNLGGDLRDGVRLTKVMEIISMQDSLTANLRVPAISRLQKIHNMKIVFGCLERAGYKILYDIEPRDIVDGHKEKTLSFLWQIVYKFEAPLMVKSATTIQTWFRSLPVTLNRRRRERMRLRCEAAAKKIQAWYRRQKLIKKLEHYRALLERYILLVKREKAAVKIQSYYRMYHCRRLFLMQRNTALNIQRFARGWLIRNVRRYQIKQAVLIQNYIRMYLARKRYLALKKAVEVVQARYRAKKEMKATQTYYIQQKSSAIVIQRWYRSVKLLRTQHDEYQKLRTTTIYIQQKFRANLICKIERKRYLEVRSATIRIQTWYRSIVAVRIHRQEFLALKKSVIIIQRRYIAQKVMKIERDKYQERRRACIVIQRRFRAYKSMKLQRQSYLELKTAAVTIQNRHRANVASKKERRHFEALKSLTVFVQRRFRANRMMRIDYKNYTELREASVKIQIWFRATMEMRKRHTYYVSLKYAVSIFEERYQAKKLMERDRRYYKELRSAAVTLQRRYRALVCMREAKTEFLRLRDATNFIQRRRRANVLCRTERNRFLAMRNAAKVIQSYWRGRKICKQLRSEYETLRTTVVMVQKRWRLKRIGERDRNDYLKLKKAVVVIQRRWRARALRKTAVERYTLLRTSTIVLQQRWRERRIYKQLRSEYETLRATVVMVQRRWRLKRMDEQDRNDYLALRKAAVVIQRRWRARALMRAAIERYTLLRTSATVLQQRWRERRIYKQLRSEYETLRTTVVMVQRRWRLKRIAEQDRNNYLALRTAAIVIQRRWRAQTLMKTVVERYTLLRTSTIVLQQRWRERRIYKQDRSEYETLRTTVVMVQRRWRLKRIAEQDRNNYLALRTAAIVIQRRWRARTLMKTVVERYTLLRTSTIVLQQRWRERRIYKQDRNEYETLRTTVVMVQRRWRLKRIAEQDRNNYLALRTAAIVIQRRWRARTLMKTVVERYTLLRTSTIVLQQRWRERKIYKQLRSKYVTLRSTVVMVQRRWRLKRIGEQVRNDYLALRTAAVVIQRKWRARALMKIAMERYTLLKYYTVRIQIKFRANVLMKQQRERYLKMRSSAVVIQKFYRGYVSMKNLRFEFIVNRKAVLELQRFIRGYLVRSNYSHYFTDEEKEKRRIARIERAAAVKIQAAWRGYKSRSLDTPKLVEINRRMKKANMNAETIKTLGSRCAVALQMLVNDKATVAGVNKALQDLDFITRHCREICEQVAPFLPKQMYRMISTTNRSLPEMRACIFSVQVLLNIGKYKPTRPYTFFPEDIEHIVTVMIHWCDKESQLFPTMCTLLWLFAHTPGWREFIRSVPNIKQKFLKMQTQILRKQGMVRKAAGRTQSVFAPYENLPLPALVPDWGLDYKRRPYVFGNSVHGFTSLLEILSL